MDILLGVFTWERFLVVWGLIAPAIAWLTTRRWDRSNQLLVWKHEADLDAERERRAGQRAAEDRARSEVEQLRERMRDVYTRFLSHGAGIALAAELRDDGERTTAFATAIPPFTQSFHELLLVSSTDVASAAVAVWKLTLTLRQLAWNDAGVPEARAQLQQARSQLVSQAREDLEDPIVRNANPGIVIKPALTVGGFHLQDVG
jgi:hypothetical protein